MAHFDGLQEMGGGLVLGPIRDDCKPVVVGIDFGTAYSGIAFAYKADPGSIQCGAPTATDSTQMKVPTALLQLEDGTWEFGYAAESKYNEILMIHKSVSPDSPLPAHLYKRFKMVLKDSENGFDSLTAFSIAGKMHPLMELVVIALGKLKDFAMEKVTNGFGSELKAKTDVQWVLTVPAIWNDFGKSFMRKAAFKAGLMETEQADNLMLVLEPEGAALAVHVGATQHGLLGAASRFMVLDCGGGTVDITVHEVIGVQPLSMKAIAVPTGGDWGGDYVNLEFKKFLKELLGPDLFREAEAPHEFYTIMCEFDRVKMNFDPNNNPSNIRLIDVLEHKKDLAALVEKYNLHHPDTPVIINPTLRNGFLTMSKALMMSFFEPFLLATVNETRKVMKTHENIQNIMVVGGFGSSKVLTERIRAEFQNSQLGVRVILPDNRPKPQAAIVHGAVYFGLHKHIIQSRVAGYTYGVAVRENNVDECFSVLVTKGEELPHDHEASMSGIPASDQQDALTWRVYRSDKLAPTTVTGEHLLGRLTADCPPNKDAQSRRQKGAFKFGGSEIRVTIENAKGEIFHGEINMV